LNPAGVTKKVKLDTLVLGFICFKAESERSSSESFETNKAKIVKQFELCFRNSDTNGCA